MLHYNYNMSHIVPIVTAIYESIVGNLSRYNFEPRQSIFRLDLTLVA